MIACDVSPVTMFKIWSSVLSLRGSTMNSWSRERAPTLTSWSRMFSCILTPLFAMRCFSAAQENYPVPLPLELFFPLQTPSFSSSSLTTLSWASSPASFYRWATLYNNNLFPLQKLNSVVKAFASALELVITALVSEEGAGEGVAFGNNNPSQSVSDGNLF